MAVVKLEELRRLPVASRLREELARQARRVEAMRDLEGLDLSTLARRISETADRPD